MYKPLQKAVLIIALGTAVTGCTQPLGSQIRGMYGLSLRTDINLANHIALARAASAQTERLFSDKTRECLAGLDDAVAYKNLSSRRNKNLESPGGFYIHHSETGLGTVVVRYDLLEKGLAPQVNFHEKLHRIEACGLIDMIRFINAYEAIDPLKYPLKKDIEEALKSDAYNGRKKLNDERMAHMIEKWVWNGYEIPQDIIDIVAPSLNIDAIMAKKEELKANVGINGLTGITVR